MTDTVNLALPFIEGGQAQKHVTHNEALRILDAVIQVAVLDASRAAPPASPAEGDRHIIALAATGAWSGHAADIATWEDGAWRFLTPNAGWIAWSIADDTLRVFDGTSWRDLRDLPPMFDHLGVNTAADATNRLSVRSNAVLMTGTAVADGGSGDVRLQLSKSASTNTASVVFSDAYSGRAEFGLIGSDAFKLKVSPNGTTFNDAFAIDASSANLTLPRGLLLTGAISPAQITSNQNDYAPSGFASASVLRLSTDAPRNLTGLAGGEAGRLVFVQNVGSSSAVLKNENTSSAAANRFALGADVTLASSQGVPLVYDGVASRWRSAASAGGGAGTVSSVAIGNGLAGASNPITSSGDIRIDPACLRTYIAGLSLSNNVADAVNDIDIAAGVATADDQSQLIKLTSALTKRLDAAWSVGTGNGGLDTGSIANTTYHLWLVQRSDTGVVDALFSTSATSPAMPANYDRKRRIGAVIRVSGSILAFSQKGDDFSFAVAIADLSSGSWTSTAADQTLTVPSGIQVEAKLRGTFLSSSGTNYAALYPKSESDFTVQFDNADVSAILNTLAGTFARRVLTNTSATVRKRSSDAAGAGTIRTTGWIDRRGQDS